MDVLVLGGTVFLGRAVVSTALAQGARVAVFNRGRSGVAPDGVEQISGDRTVAADLDQLAGRRFDVVVDTSGYVPADVARSAELLADRCGHYAFVSTINVFPGWPGEADYQLRGTHTGDPGATADDVPAEPVQRGREIVTEVRVSLEDQQLFGHRGGDPHVVSPDERRVRWARAARRSSGGTCCRADTDPGSGAARRRTGREAKLSGPGTSRKLRMAADPHS